MKKTTKKQAGELITAFQSAFMSTITGGNERMLDTYDGSHVQDFIDAKPEDRLVMLREWFNNGCKLKKVFANTFILGDVFKARETEGGTRLYFWESFDKNFIRNNLERKIAIRTDLGKLSQYGLPRNMRDGAIQQACKNPGYMDYDTAFCIWYLLIFEKETAKQLFGIELSKNEYYVFHVKMDDGTVLAVGLYWLGAGWHFYACAFDRQRGWSEGGVFVCFPATKK